MFWWIGVYAVFLWCYNGFLESLLGIIWGSLKNLLKRERFPERYGKWAVVTGSSDGIGRQYADQLAQKGMNILLISRTEHKLIAVAAEIERKYGVQTKWLAVDFSKGPEIYKPLREQLASIEVGMLVNNVGHLPPPSQTFEENFEHDINSVIRLNVVATTMMTRIVLPGMLRRRKGIIINVSSSSGYHPVPGMAIYAASKVYTTSFGLGLAHELRGTGVECQTVTPFLVSTSMSQEFTKNLSPLTAVLDVKRYVKAAVCTIGKTAYTCGHWMNTLQLFYINIVSPSLAAYIIGITLKQRRSELLKKK
ncbi:very-long-chain 3-oxoacyl-CoA reductase-like isoform X1 [Culex pipiens pallens]|uniref:very-long-chain 3-oxoacyl-CoA reductase-like isoform X1 n=1 Tax=Culex pipiens pallens TaxID=42434 RepID=UPI0019540E6C|nr:very-long-chain 3-oxoacyl-CoA reductase-like isoform X1 [Culex pipiens pallens]